MTDILTADQAAPFPDIPRLRKAVEWVEAQAALPPTEREWDQRMWRTTPESRFADHAYLDIPETCGTTYCVAGKVCDDAGVSWMPQRGIFCSGDLDGQRGTAGDLAPQILGITAHEADRLFMAHNTAADVRAVGESIAARVGERL